MQARGHRWIVSDNSSPLRLRNRYDVPSISQSQWYDEPIPDAKCRMIGIREISVRQIMDSDDGGLAHEESNDGYCISRTEEDFAARVPRQLDLLPSVTAEITDLTQFDVAPR